MTPRTRIPILEVTRATTVAGIPPRLSYLRPMGPTRRTCRLRMKFDNATSTSQLAVLIFAVLGIDTRIRLGT